MVDEPTEKGHVDEDEGAERRGRARLGGASRRRVALAALAALCIATWLVLALGGCGSSPPPRMTIPRPLSESDSLQIQEPVGDFSEFSHVNAQHARLPCLLCHRREDDSAHVKLPGHMPCAGCHAKQFADAASPICSICHTDRATGAVKPFPRLHSFDVAFDHTTHVREAGRSRAGCATCHQPSRRGVALSIPSGEQAHATCFKCHTPRAQAEGRDISSCGVCHREGTPAKVSESSVAYTRSFDHGEHGRAGLACTACHSVRPGATGARQVTAPVPAMHHAPAGSRSCASCHDGQRAFGGTDFSSCARCHQGDAWRF